MSNTIEHLLIPRYECIGQNGEHYPGSNRKVGDIITMSQYHINKEGVAAQFDKYPHLFRPLHWAEKREIGDLPEYISIRLTQGLVVQKIRPINYTDKKFMKWQFGNNDITRWSPSTEQDYLTYINGEK